ncbi:hypothetical protein [Streptomyces sp. ok210]|uniref:hypothetical protein n=1 Tax=Streptomyces sp. ok210 TaxID=1761905 RepID=UPI0008ECC16D|nr:hypothetical protein [Streptomyces sp. ok210]SFT31865.1 hypothetical protein SAMN04487982_12481 [Streptomyces sp. ok210]
MSTQTPAITKDTARHVLWHYGREGGFQPGSFTRRLMEAMDAADIVNLAILGSVYPELAAALYTAKNEPNGIAELQRIAGGLRCIRCKDTDGPFGGAPQQPLCEPCLKAAS